MDRYWKEVVVEYTKDWYKVQYLYNTELVSYKLYQSFVIDSHSAVEEVMLGQVLGFGQLVQQVEIWNY